MRKAMLSLITAAFLIVAMFVVFGHSEAKRVPFKCKTLHVLGKQGETSLEWDYDTKSEVEGAVWLRIENPLEVECEEGPRAD
jgi:hypothetical protein